MVFYSLRWTVYVHVETRSLEYAIMIFISSLYFFKMCCHMCINKTY